jgi:phage portal protein BeeE
MVSMEAQLRIIRGDGKDSFLSILKNLFILKKALGDSFAEIVRNDNGTLINLKPMAADKVRIVYNKQGIIKRYEEKETNNKYKPEQMLHFRNMRIGSEMHGNSVLQACKWAIDARNEAMADYRVVLHRNRVPVRIIEVDEDKQTKIDALKTKYGEAIKKGEVLIIPKGTVEIKETTITIQDPTTWIQYLEDFIYRALGVPKIIMGGSDQFTQADNKIGYLTFEQVYSSEQRELEIDLENQLGIVLEFNRPISLKDKVQQDEVKNTSQTGFQPNDTQAGVGE